LKEGRNAKKENTLKRSLHESFKIIQKRSEVYIVNAVVNPQSLLVLRLNNEVTVV